MHRGYTIKCCAEWAQLWGVAGGLLCLSVFCSTIQAQPAQQGNADADGCRDSRWLARLTGCFIVQCASKENDTVQVQTGKGLSPADQTELEGRVLTLNYRCGKDRSPAQLAQAADQLLHRNKFNVVFSGTDESNSSVVTGHTGNHWIEFVASEGDDPTFNSYTVTTVQTIGEPRLASKSTDSNILAKASVNSKPPEPPSVAPAAPPPDEKSKPAAPIPSTPAAAPEPPKPTPQPSNLAPAPAPVPAPAAVTGVDEIRNTAVFEPPIPVSRVAPSVPPDLRKLLNSEIQIDVKVSVDAVGKVTRAVPLLKPLETQKYLANLAVSTAYLWQFRPAKQNGQSVEGEAIVSFRFGPPKQK